MKRARPDTHKITHCILPMEVYQASVLSVDHPYTKHKPNPPNCHSNYAVFSSPSPCRIGNRCLCFSNAPIPPCDAHYPRPCPNQDLHLRLDQRHWRPMQPRQWWSSKVPQVNGGNDSSLSPRNGTIWLCRERDGCGTACCRGEWFGLWLHLPKAHQESSICILKPDTRLPGTTGRHECLHPFSPLDVLEYGEGLMHCWSGASDVHETWLAVR